MPSTLIQNPTLDDTIAAMTRLSQSAKKDLGIIQLARKRCAQLEPGDYNSEIVAVYRWVCRNIRYVRDINNVEFVMSPQKIVEARAGDCDDMACLLSALLQAIGNECRFVVVGFESKQPSHVFCQVAVRSSGSVDGHTSGERLWVTLDPVADENTAQMHTRVQFVRVHPL